MNLRWNFDFGVRVSILRHDGKTIHPDGILFEVMAPGYGLQPEISGESSRAAGSASGQRASIPVGPDIRCPLSVSRMARGTSSRLRMLPPFCNCS
jgi:hypothetical protein